ncbi:hypothetical protein GOB98_22870 [Sinorhizobium meliloti]|uniref:hypothetical protein n=1 Tax=Rhizobium meliloti TaxID=382 RepID=UPI00299E3850|nr:hypothetical protein [Sinorhizobium meliloti]MDW9978885.1 hypothetical protein [Sinorhizobium meliloti]MDX0295509.1 hypothetical protein [Sinorhizobium meliloti]
MIEPREKRVPFMMSERELLEVDDWRFKNKVATRADALRRLCKLGLALDELLPQLQGALDEAKAAANKAQKGLSVSSDKSRESGTKTPVELALTSLKLGKVVNVMTTKARVLKENEYPEEKLRELDERSDEVARAFKVLEANLLRSAQK